MTPSAHDRLHDVTGNYLWNIVVADSATAAEIDNSIHFTATSN